MATALASLVTINYPTPVKRTSFDANVVIGAETWTPGVIEVSAFEQKSGVADRRMTVKLDAESNADRAVFLTDPGPVAVTVEWASRAEGSSTWAKLPIKHVGKYSIGRVTDVEVDITVETLKGTIFAGRTPTMTDAYQRAEYSGDRGFEYAEKLAVEGILLRPPGG